MGGLAAAAEASEQGARVLVFEKGSRVGGSMLLSSGVIWRHRSFEQFREECPTGDEKLQRTIYERLDQDLRWLSSLGALVVEEDTGNSATVGMRFFPRELANVLAARVTSLRLNEPLAELPGDVPVVLATGGFQANPELVRRYVTPEAHSLLLRSNPWSSGDGLRLGLTAGGKQSSGMSEFYGRNMPAPPARVRETEFVDLAQLYAHHATVVGASGDRYTAKTWSEIDVVQWTSRQPGATARYVVPRESLELRIRDRTVSDMIDAAREAGARVEEDNGSVAVPVVASITSTLGGLEIDEEARVSDGVFACGNDAGGVSTGGYSSGLAAALVFGRIAARSALA